MSTPKQPAPQKEAPHKTADRFLTYAEHERILDGVRTAYSKVVNHVKKQQAKIEQLEERIEELTSLLEIVQQRQVDMETREQVREQQKKQATPAPEQSPAVAPQPEQQTHHTTALSEGQIKRAYAIAHRSGIQPADMKKWVQQNFAKELKDLDRKDYNRLCAILEQAKGKGVLPNLQPGREYSQAS